LAWIQAPPPFLSIASESGDEDAFPLLVLDDGKRAAIARATALRADLLLMADHAGAAAARPRCFAVTGTFARLDRVAGCSLLDLKKAGTQLQATSFHIRPAPIEIPARQSPIGGPRMIGARLGPMSIGRPHPGTAHA
jgi:hypothetical protein